MDTMIISEDEKDKVEWHLTQRINERGFQQG